MNIENHVHSFFHEVGKGRIEIYNEFSLQHELGIYLRERVSPSFKVQFERNIRFFYPGVSCVKSEMDIVIYSPEERYSIELKYPNNGQYPETMFQFVKDIKFMEEVKNLGFTETFAVAFTEDRLFYDGKKVDGIYGFFRNGNIVHGAIQKPTGQSKEVHTIDGHYGVEWLSLGDVGKYYLLSI
ncbi:hypothetical protein [Salimicrobium halophilum]|uniref:Uncharacterized protein n=1 Tax=Salimicrobium halophilum TaxID=86666 RepID=A0A1G8QVD8_9BACI|nr:hypothetical protein [Salimicrobium halophilum]SDJ08719.1 hypothetical protein SAMN04490247_0655 [Salimicrobium halophilum]